MPLPTIQELRDLAGSYRFILELQRISGMAADGDVAAGKLLAAMLADGKDWQNDSRWISAALGALARAGTTEALDLMLEHARDLPPDAPYGRVELLASLLSAFAYTCGPQAVPGLLALARTKAGGPARAAGLQSLCHFYLEGQLNAEQCTLLKKEIIAFDRDSYFTQDSVDLVLHSLEHKSDSLPEWDYEAILVDS